MTLPTTTRIATRSQQTATEIANGIRARQPIIQIVSREEGRVEPWLFKAATALRSTPMTWDVAQGIADASGKILEQYEGSQDPGTALNYIRDAAASGQPNVWIMRDLPAWFQGPSGATIVRQLRNLARTLPKTDVESSQAIIILSPGSDVPPELTNHTAVIDWPLPDRSEIEAILDEALSRLSDEQRASAAPMNGDRAKAIDAAVGLSGEEALACYYKSLVTLKRIDPVAVAAEKKRVITREKALEWHDPLPGGLDSVGGLGNLKAWLRGRSNAYSPKARSYGLPAPKGAFLVGVQGCGKSMVAKAIGTGFGIPVVKLDLNALKSKFVGESEGALRQIIKTIEALGRVVVWIDEIEKALQGATSGSADGGVSTDALGTILSWMQERKSEAFIIATANDVEALPPELLRKGRFDEVFFVDTPSASERGEVLRSALSTHGRGNVVVNYEAVAQACPDFTGSEIAELVPSALYMAFADGEREITTADLIAAAKTTVPLTRTYKTKIDNLRAWAKGKARPASSADRDLVRQEGPGLVLDM